VLSGGVGAYRHNILERGSGGVIVPAKKKIDATCSVILNLYILYKRFPSKPFEL